MKTINSIRKEGLDVYHLRIEDEKQLKNDYVELSTFEKLINAPMSVYEDKIHSLVIKKQLHRVLIYASMEVKQILEQYGIFGRYNFSFAGEYNDEMKNEIEEYVVKNGLNKMERKTKIKENDNAIKGAIEFYGTIPTEGFYFSRQGLLRGNVAKNCHDILTGQIPTGNLFSDKFSGNLSDAENIREYLDIDYAKYLYGEKGPQQLLDYYQKNFIDNFEYGRSFLMVYQ